MAMLPKVVVHEAFTRKKDKEGDGAGGAGGSVEGKMKKEGDVGGPGGSGEGKTKTLADYVHPRKMEQVREACRATHGMSSCLLEKVVWTDE